jgi:DNA-binding transcriptional MerR regulator
MGAKGPEAFRTISEAAAEVGVAPHVLRYWESRLAFIRPLRRPGGRRLYRPADIRLLSAVKRRLHEEGLSIEALRAMPRGAWTGRRPIAPPPAPPDDALRQALAWALAAKARLDGALRNPAGAGPRG